jgi:DNA-binding LacI/PurR family transcriptional regulator
LRHQAGSVFADIALKTVGCRFRFPDVTMPLRELGHKWIAYIGGEPPPWGLASPRAKSVETQRAECFRRSMRSAGLGAPDEFVRLGPYCIKGADHQPGRTMTHEVLALRDKPTAVIIGSDLLAAGALQALHESGVRVPDEMSVIGYDDTLAEILTPPLTSIAQPIDELGRNAVTLALEAIADLASPARRILAPTRLVVRHSVARPRSAS